MSAHASTAVELAMQPGFDQGRDRVALLVIDADHLLGMPVLRRPM